MSDNGGGGYSARVRDRMIHMCTYVCECDFFRNHNEQCAFMFCLFGWLLNVYCVQVLRARCWLFFHLGFKLSSSEPVFYTYMQSQMAVPFYTVDDRKTV